MFLNKIRNIFCVPRRTQNLCPQQMFRARTNGETFVSAAMRSQQCVLVCQSLYAWAYRSHTTRKNGAFKPEEFQKHRFFVFVWKENILKTLLENDVVAITTRFSFLAKFSFKHKSKITVKC